MGERGPEFNPEAEHIPTREEVRGLIEQLAKGEALKETRVREDEKGLYLWDMEVAGEKPGETTEFSYMRQGTFKEGAAANSTVQATYYEDGMPVGGKTVADLVDSKWVMK